MRILYPYNEILPKKRAHDVYIVNQCQAFGEAGDEVLLLSGRGSESDDRLRNHYGIPHQKFSIKRLPIVRKNNFLSLSWNRVFFHFCQREIDAFQPDVVFLSVHKQGNFHLKRKRKNTVYVYEVHELAYYPTIGGDPKAIKEERALLEKADLITVTTEQLATILLHPPYSLRTRMAVLPLAVKGRPLLPPPIDAPFTVAYVGQLYQGQGMDLLLEALAQTSTIQLMVIGGKQNEVAHYSDQAARLGIKKRVTFLGFQHPSALPTLLQRAHAFVAPFEAKGKMAYVAHTKLHEYAMWGRPIVAPNLPVVRELFPSGIGVELFSSGDISSLANALEKIGQKTTICVPSFSWEERVNTYKKIVNIV